MKLLLWYRNSETQRNEAEAKAEARPVEITAEVQRLRPVAETAAETERIRTAAEVESVRQCEQIGQIFGGSPALLRLRELEALC